MSETVLRKISRNLLERRWITGSLALLLLAAAMLLAWQSERRQNEEQVRQTSISAQILASSLAGALAFDDEVTAREYLNAMSFDKNVLAAGIYNEQGVLLAGFTRRGEELPQRIGPREPQIDGLKLGVVEPVREGNLELGQVYLRTSVEPLAARISRYLAIGIILLLAALLIVILGAATAAARASNRELQEQIAAREEAEMKLHQAQKMEALGQLTGGVAHDFNNLLMAASSGLELLGRAKNEERRERLKEGIRDALDRGARITQQLLAFSRRQPLQTEVVHMNRHMAKLAELLDHSLHESVSVKFAVADDVWPVEIDVSQFDVAILNLAVNAKDAMPKGGEICITAHNRRGALDGEDAVEIAVEDEGTGMPAEAMAKAFEPFFTTKEVGRGTGLGLSQVYGFAHGAGGTASIDSRPGAGTKVAMLLPRCHSVASEAEVEALPGLGDRLRDIEVLLVEDDPHLNQLVGDMLEEQGSTVRRASSADAGLQLFEKHPIGAVLSDMVMPGEMDGLDLARRLRRLRPDVPIVLMTGYSAAAGSAAKEGFHVLRKPFRMEALAACFDQVLRSERG